MPDKPEDKRIAVVQTCRYGDVCNMLPPLYALHEEGHEIHAYSSLDFCELYEACSYIHVHPIPINYHNLAIPFQQAKADGFTTIVVSQVDANPIPALVQCKNFILEQWARIHPRFLEKWNDLPLVFDKRDTEGEAETVQRLFSTCDSRPIILYNLEGHSSRWDQRRQFEKWMHATLGAAFNLVDISVRLKKVHHLLGVLEKGDLLITIDTLTTHLSYHSKIPTIALSLGSGKDGEIFGWYDSEPRQHWIARLTYRQALTLEGQEEIKAAIYHEFPSVSNILRFHHIVDWFLGNERDNARILNARKTWETLAEKESSYRLVLHELDIENQRTSKDVGDTKPLPFMCDIIDYACEDADDDDVVFWTNSDICLVPETIRELRKKLKNAPCCYSRRIDVQDAKKVRHLDDLALEIPYAGTDLFAFRVSWWVQHRHEFPDMIYAYDTFDAVMRWKILEHNIHAEMRPPVGYHEIHVRGVHMPNHLFDTPGRRHNHELCQQFCEENGYQKAISGLPGPNYHVKKDEEWGAIDAISGRHGEKLFLPFIGEVGWMIMHQMRLVHFTEAKSKIVCCKIGQEALFPSATDFFYDWESPDKESPVGTGKNYEWKDIRAKFPLALPVHTGGLSTHEEFKMISQGHKIPLTPRFKRDLAVDVCIGTRNLPLLPEKNYQHWQKLADTLTEMGLTFAVIGTRDSSYALKHMKYMSGDFGDWDAAIELLQNCNLFVSTDSGSAHLASVVDACPMIIQAVPKPPEETEWGFTTNWGWIRRMKKTASQRIVELGAEFWDDPQVLVSAVQAQFELVTV